MTVDKALEVIRYLIDEIIANYALEEPNGTHTLYGTTDDEILATLDRAIHYACFKVTPTKLLVGIDSTSDFFRAVDELHYLRVPNYPVLGEELDIDEGIAYAVCYLTITLLDSKEVTNKQIAQDILSSYPLILDTENISTTYARFSVDGVTWNTHYTNGDTYVSFKQQDTLNWSEPIMFKGEKGDKGDSGSSNFIGLSDTPYTLEANKYLQVNGAGDALVFVDAPTGGGSSSGFYDIDGTGGAVSFDPSNGEKQSITLVTDTTITVTESTLSVGVNYMLQIIDETMTLTKTLSFNNDNGGEALGNNSIVTSDYVTFIEFIYDGYGMYILTNQAFN